MTSAWVSPPERAVKFAAVGVVNTLIDLTVFTLLVHAAGWPPAAAHVASYSTGLLNSFVLNRTWTFSGAGRHPAWLQLVLFSLVNLGGLGLGTLIVWLVSPLTSPLVAKLCSLPLTFAWNYSLSGIVAFRPSSTPAPAPEPRHRAAVTRQRSTLRRRLRS